jgi:transcriptional regulator GlxA family with amidase domain
VIHVKKCDGYIEPWLSDALRLMAEKANPDSAGAQTIINHLVQLLFIQAIRLHMTSPSDGNGNWLAALRDSQIGPILALMHTRTRDPWTVASPAEKAGMSRSGLAARFVACVGRTPMQYLLECRMRQACRLLRETRSGLKQIARIVGYGSGSAFSNVFKRWSRLSPGAYRDGASSGRWQAERDPVHEVLPAVCHAQVPGSC